MRIGLSLKLSEPKYNVLAQNIQALFADGSQGWWYDDNDTTTLFQDSAGTTPVTAVEQFVGLQLDKSKGGVGTNGTRRVNLLTYTERFDNAAWMKVAATVTANATTAPDGTSTADLLVETAATNNHRVSQSLGTLQAQTLTVSIRHKAGVGTRNLDFAIVGGASFVATVFSTTTGAVLANNDSAGSIFSGKQNSVSGPDAYGFYTSTITVNLLSAQIVTAIFGLADGTNNNYLGNGTSGIFIWGADLRLAADANVSPTYQRITDTWYNTLPGNHRYAPASGNRLIWSKRVNLLTKTEQFDDAYWLKQRLSVSGSVVTPIGTMQGIVEDNTTNSHRVVVNGVTVPASTNQTFSCYARANTRNFVYLSIQSGSNNEYITVVYDLVNGTVSASSVGALLGTLVSSSITAVGSGVYRISFTYSIGTKTTVYPVIGISDSAAPSIATSGDVSYAGNGTSGIYIWGADLRPANQATGTMPLYQRVNTSTDYDTNGFPGYLKADGVDDFLQTNSVNFTATDKITLCAGVRKLSDAASGIAVELSANLDTNNGCFDLVAPGSAGANSYRFNSKGTVAAAAGTGVFAAAPDTSVLTGIGDISGDVTTLRRNGAVVQTSTADQGTGNFGNYVTYFFSRGGSGLRFNGYEYGNVAVGKLLTADQTVALETYMNGLTKAY